MLLRTWLMPFAQLSKSSARIWYTTFAGSILCTTSWRCLYFVLITVGSSSKNTVAHPWLYHKLWGVRLSQCVFVMLRERNKLYLLATYYIYRLNVVCCVQNRGTYNSLASTNNMKIFKADLRVLVNIPRTTARLTRSKDLFWRKWEVLEQQMEGIEWNSKFLSCKLWRLAPTVCGIIPWAIPQHCQKNYQGKWKSSQALACCYKQIARVYRNRGKPLMSADSSASSCHVPSFFQQSGTEKNCSCLNAGRTLSGMQRTRPICACGSALREGACCFSDAYQFHTFVSQQYACFVWSWCSRYLPALFSEHYQNPLDEYCKVSLYVFRFDQNTNTHYHSFLSLDISAVWDQLIAVWDPPPLHVQATHNDNNLMVSVSSMFTTGQPHEEPPAPVSVDSVVSCICDVDMFSCGSSPAYWSYASCSRNPSMFHFTIPLVPCWTWRQSEREPRCRWNKQVCLFVLSILQCWPRVWSSVHSQVFLASSCACRLKRSAETRHLTHTPNG